MESKPVTVVLESIMPLFPRDTPYSESITQYNASSLRLVVFHRAVQRLEARSTLPRDRCDWLPLLLCTACEPPTTHSTRRLFASAAYYIAKYCKLCGVGLVGPSWRYRQNKSPISVAGVMVLQYSRRRRSPSAVHFKRYRAAFASLLHPPNIVQYGRYQILRRLQNLPTDDHVCINDKISITWPKPNLKPNPKHNPKHKLTLS